MKRVFLFFTCSLLIILSCFCQETGNSGVRILFRGIVLDAGTLSPISNSQIMINREFTAVSDTDGTFAFFVNRHDSVLFKHLGYKPETLFVSDTLAGKDFIAGIYLTSDTLLIGEVVILPRFMNLKSEILNTPSKVPSTMDNARYNVSISAYAGKTTKGSLGDPETNYNLLHQKQKIDAFEKGEIPSDRIAGFNPLLILPAVYLILHGLPEKPPSIERRLTPKELEMVQKKYMESLK